MIRRDEADFVPTGVENGAAPYLGPVAPDERGLIQRIDTDTLLPRHIRDMLFRRLAESF
jgi:chemotaxis-related protein WspB